MTTPFLPTDRKTLETVWLEFGESVCRELIP